MFYRFSLNVTNFISDRSVWQLSIQYTIKALFVMLIFSMMYLCRSPIRIFSPKFCKVLNLTLLHSLSPFFVMLQLLC